MSDQPEFNIACPVPHGSSDRIQLAHGGGGRMMHQLISDVIAPAFDNEWLATLHDGALADMPSGRLAFTTDSYVVQPLFFPGSDIGRLAVNGTVNDLAMCGAIPQYLSCALILEEGLEFDVLRAVLASMKAAADEAGVHIVTGDTKVVEHGNCDSLYINTAGVGVVPAGRVIGPGEIHPGDAIIVSGDIGRHGIAVMTEREGLQFGHSIESDCAPLSSVVQEILSSGAEVHCLRDLTRGGLASCLVEFAGASQLRVEIEDDLIPVSEPVKNACEILGLDPMSVACEGRFVAVVPASQSARVIDIMNRESSDAVAIQIGAVREERDGLVVSRTALGTRRVIELPAGEQLPRIC